MTAITLLYFVLIAAVAFGAGYFMRKSLAEAKIQSAEEAAQRILQDAEREAEARQREVMLEAKEEAHKPRSELEQENRDRRHELQQVERRLLQKEESLIAAQRTSTKRSAFGERAKRASRG